MKKNRLDKGYQRDRRTGADRRADTRFTFKSLFNNGKREEIRRHEDKQRIFIADRYSSTIFAGIVVILLFTIFDGLLTLILLAHGAKEINPLMAFLLEIEPKIFMIVKYLLTCASLFAFLIFRNFFLHRLRIYSRTLFPIVIGAFATVIVWELYLLYRVVILNTN